MESSLARGDKALKLKRRACNNRSGITGVSRFLTDDGKLYWRAFAGRRLLYRGKDFFEACVKRKSWESKEIKSDG